MNIFILAAVVACIARTVTQEKIFEGFRSFCDRLSVKTNSTAVKKICYLPTCHYCFSHYPALLVVWLTGFRLPVDVPYLRFVLTWFALVAITNVYIIIYTWITVTTQMFRARTALLQARRVMRGL